MEPKNHNDPHFSVHEAWVGFIAYVVLALIIILICVNI